MLEHSAMKTVLYFALLLVAVATTQSNGCDVRDQMISSGVFDPNDEKAPCRDPCDETGVDITGQENCTQAQFCHWDAQNSACWSKKVVVSQDRQVNEQDASMFVSSIITTAGASNATTGNGIEGRYFSLGGGPPPGGPAVLPPVQPQYSVFPYNCGINPYDPLIYKLLESPVNVPYCMRIPCSKSDPSLEISRFGCLSRPGCAYDVQLANIRAAKGHAVLPGVPVCHLAIRNVQFHKLANDYIQKTGSKWNALHTRCFLKQHGAAILKAPCGCEIISSLRYFGIQPKIAGWPGITETECHLINGCFKKNQCYFPATSEKIQIRSAEDNYRSLHPTGRDIYGQPLCLPFDLNAKPVDYLSNYHSCRLSGCAVDPIIGFEQIRKHLCSIALSDVVPSYLKQKFWRRVQQGFIRADNWKEELNNLRLDTCPPLPLPGVNNVFPAAFSLDVSGRSSPNSTTNSRKKRSVNNLFPNYLPGCSSFAGFNFNFPGAFPTQKPFGFSLSVQPNSYGLNANPNYGAGVGALPYPLPFPGPLKPRCPYQNVLITGYARLKGSFAGCCEQHYCYIPRPDLGAQFSGVAVYNSYWGAWTSCSQSCGGGLRTRSRACVGKGTCPGLHEQSERCGDGPCPYWGGYGDWGQCSRRCGGGQQTRQRRCLPSGKGCDGKSQESRNCNIGSCPFYSPWSSYSPCSASCGEGWETRSRTCTDGAYPCSILNEQLTEKRRCQIYCGQIREIGKTACKYPTCTVTKSYECRYQNGPGYCLGFNPTKTERCRDGFCGLFG